jgi:hypothetical protein
MKVRKVVGALGAVLLTVALLANLRGALSTDGDVPLSSNELVAQLRNAQFAAWRVKEAPLGQTEFLQDQIEQVLSFDDAVLLHFNHNQRLLDFQIYVAYWRPGDATLREVGGHTPDTCWTNSGWVATDRVSPYRIEATGVEVVPGEYRRFTKQGMQINVAFWHIAGRKSIPLMNRGYPSLRFILSDLFGHRQYAKGEQVFIRISSEAPLEELWSLPVFQQIIQILEPSGISSGTHA